MNHRTFLSLLLMMFVSVTLAVAAPPSDAEASKLLAGEWVMPPDRLNAVVKGASFQFKEDGIFTSKGLLLLREEKVQIEFDGKWSIKDGVLTEEITHTSHPAIIPSGLVTRDTIISITDKEYKIRTAKGQEERYVKP